MDKRIYKTKKGLQEALQELLGEMSFDKISVSQICERAATSRVTFYTYYNDKYDLLSDLYDTMAEKAEMNFMQKQKENNPDNETSQSLENLLDVLIAFEKEPAATATRVVSEREITHLYMEFILRCIEKFETISPLFSQSRYPEKALNSFFAFGLWGFLHSSNGEITEQDRKNASRLLKDLVNSPIFREEIK